MLFKNLKRNFSTATNESISTSLYLWRSNLYRMGRTDDMKNLQIKNIPGKFQFFEGKNPQYIYTGPRHSAVVTENGDLYTFGTGNWGVLGHGNEDEISYPHVKKVDYFSQNKIKIKKACLGDYHSIALTENGEVYTWGFGGKKGFLDYGALGHGDVDNHFLPKKVKFFEDNGIVVKDIACGIRHCVILTEQGEVYTWGRGEYGLLGNGSNSGSLVPLKNEFIEMYIKEDPNNEIVKIDCADEYTGALTKGGDLYVWGKNNQGQLGIGAGIGITCFLKKGVDFIESEKFPTLVLKPKEVKYKDLSCGENCMMMLDDLGVLHKTGWRIDYVPSLINVSKVVKTRFFCCGNSFYCMVDESNNVYQWGNLFKKKIAEKTDSDMEMIMEKLFDGEIMMMSGKFKICGAIINNKV